MTKQHSCVRLRTFIILHSQTKTSNSWIMKKNIFIGSRPGSRDREVIIFENYSCSSLFLATRGSTKKSQGHCWHKWQVFKSHAHHTLTAVRSHSKLKHKRFSVRFVQILIRFLLSSKQTHKVTARAWSGLQLSAHLNPLSRVDQVHQIVSFKTFPNSSRHLVSETMWKVSWKTTDLVENIQIQNHLRTPTFTLKN